MFTKNTIVLTAILIISLLGFSTKVIPSPLEIKNLIFSTKEEKVDNRVLLIDDFFSKRNMPLSGYGAKMIEVSDKYNLDWRLLPAISVRETSGGINLCKNPKAQNNPFGWGSCKIGFKSIDNAIETVGYKLANLPVYKGKSTEKKLYYYNGTVVPTYPKEVITIMNSIGSI